MGPHPAVQSSFWGNGNTKGASKGSDKAGVAPDGFQAPCVLVWVVYQLLAWSLWFLDLLKQQLSLCMSLFQFFVISFRDFSFDMYLFLSLDWICYNIASVLCFWCFCLWGIWDLNSPTRNHIGTPCVGRQSLNHWATGEVPSVFLLFLYLNYSCLPYLVHLSPSPTTFLSLAILRPPEKIDCYSLRASQLSEVFTVSPPNISWELLLPTLIRALSALLPLAGMCFWFPLHLWSSAHTERLPSPGMASPQPCCLRQNYSLIAAFSLLPPPATSVSYITKSFPTFWGFLPSPQWWLSPSYHLPWMTTEDP